MNRLTIDRTKLVRFTTYAKKRGLTRQAIYAQERSGAIEVIEIDGVKFVYLA